MPFDTQPLASLQLLTAVAVEAWYLVIAFIAQSRLRRTAMTSRRRESRMTSLPILADSFLIIYNYLQPDCNFHIVFRVLNFRPPSQSTRLTISLRYYYYCSLHVSNGTTRLKDAAPESGLPSVWSTMPSAITPSVLSADRQKLLPSALHDS